MKVAVLGAGFSGMLAAYLLEKEGIQVTIYEKQESIGGHCKTLTSKNEYIELGTTFSFSKYIKELLIELKVDYSEKFSYRNFLDSDYNNVEHMLREDIAVLMNELSELRMILNRYSDTFNQINYGFIHEDLMISLSDFLKKHNLKTVYNVIAPQLSSFGFGNINEIQAYYAFKVFDIDTIYSFIKGEKLLFINKGTSELINKLSQNISDIRYALEVINIETVGNEVKVETAYGYDLFDKVLITTKLPTDVIKDYLYNQYMKKIDTNPYFTCAYNVNDKNLVTTYYKGNLGSRGKIQFFHATRQNGKTSLVTYTYGIMNKDKINEITEDIKKTGISIHHLITVKQWYIFPHLKASNLTSCFYEDLQHHQKESNIRLIGSLITQPALSNLYISVKQSINDIIKEYKKGM